VSIEKSAQPLLIIEDDVGLQKQLKWSFEEYDVQIASNREEAIAALRLHLPKVVTLDLGLPPDPTNVSEGFKTLAEIQALMPNTKVVVVTGNDDRDNALKAIECGAYDFYHKPIDVEVLKIIIQRAFHLSELEAEHRSLVQSHLQSPLDGVIASSPEMMKICRVIEKVAPTSATTMLLGESGTGKEVLARALHKLSDRCDDRFVAINCAAIPETLLESELFGYEKGAFTGANKQTIGKLETADGGTLFLDEIGDLPLSLQAKFLRFLQERVIERIGGREEIPLDVRIICATHQDLQEMISDKLFREDLFYRLSEISITIPPVRKRTGDAVLLARALLDRYIDEKKAKVKGFTQEALQAVENYSWPGNVREMENRISRAIIMADGSHVTVDDLELDFNSDDSLPLNLKQVRDEADKQTIMRAVNMVDGNLSKAAEVLGVTRPTLYNLLDKYNLRA
jgi:two-component system NtrC family response regulator